MIIAQDIPAHTVANDKELLFELVLKNLYILTTNIAGLAIETDSTVDELRNNHLKLMRDVSSDILKLQSALTGNTGEEINTLESMPFFFSNHTEITVGLIKLCVAQSRGNNSFCIIATRSFHALGIDFGC
jgi:hypothetical protein